MSAPDPEKWAVTEADTWPAWDCVIAFRDPVEFLLAEKRIANAVARRRAIEELKALSESAMQEPNQLPICPVFTVRLEDIRQRIAAIEAEEA